jgi:MFS family permease
MGQSRGVPAAGSAGRAGVAVAALCLVQFMDVLGVTVVVTSLPAMLASLHAPDSYGSLIATGYAMFFGGLLMLGARLGDRYGQRRTILVSLAVFAAGAAVAGAAPSVLALTAGRCLQGAAAAASVPSALRLLTTLTPEGPARHRAIAAWSAAGAAAGASGFVVGGIVTELTSWRFIFWAYLPLAAALAAVVAASVPPDGARRQAESLNLAGSAIFTAAVMAFVVGTTLITQSGDRVTGGLLLAACLVLAGGFVLVDGRAAAPLLPLELIRSRWLRLGALGGLLNTATTSSVITLVTLYLQNSLGRTPWQAAASLLPFSLAVIAASILAARVQRRAGPPRQVARRLIAAGLTLIAVADAALIPLAAQAWAVPLCAAAAGAGIGLSSVAATGLGTDVEPRWRGGASGIINTAAQLGTAVGIATLLLVAAATSGTPAPGLPPPRIAWAVAALVAAVGAAWFAIARRGSVSGGADDRAAGPGGAAGARRVRPVRQDAGYGGSDRIAAGRGRGSGHHRGTERG